MKFAINFQLGLPRPLDSDQWGPDDERKMYDECCELIELADKVGFDYTVLTEHHFSEEYSHNSSPETILAAVARTTKHIRLGHGIVQMIPAMNHPSRVAERISALDLLSHGRVEFGTGEGTSDNELDAFQTPRAMKKAMWEDATRETCKMMSQVPYEGFNGEFFSFPSRNVIPKPLQKPHPPLWVACSRRETTLMAARFGMGALGFGFETAEEFGERAEEYYRIIREECMPIGGAINPALQVGNNLMIADTEEEAVLRNGTGPQFGSWVLGYYSTSPGTKRDAEGRSYIEKWQPGVSHLHREWAAEVAAGRIQAAGTRMPTEAELRAVEPSSEQARALFRMARGGAIGTEAMVRDNLLKYEAAHVDMMSFGIFGGNRKFEHVMEAVERFGKNVMPEFLERHETTHKKWREQQLDGVEFQVNSSI